MLQKFEIRADFNRDTVVVYQAYSSNIADPAVANQRFVPPFSLKRMTCIKPSFLWLMHRSNWGQKSGQERVLAVRIKRSGWEKALSEAVLTGFEQSIHRSPEEWAKAFENAKVHVQWDPERSLRGNALGYYSIQVGISRHIIGEFVQDWVVQIEDYTTRVRKIYDLLKTGQSDKVKRLLPSEQVYPVDPAIGQRLLIGYFCSSPSKR